MSLPGDRQPLDTNRKGFGRTRHVTRDRPGFLDPTFGDRPPAAKLGRASGEEPMHDNGTCLLDGPITRDRGWWSKPKRKTRATPAIRTELVERVRREIASGAYDTPERLEAAFSKMLLAIEA